MAIFDRFRRSGTRRHSRKIPFIAGITVAALTVLGATVFTLHRVNAADVDCDDNAIIRCGFSDSSDFVSKVQTNAPGDLPAIYAAFGLESADYDRMATKALQGKAFRDGHIEVGGQTVATGASSIGRLKSFQGTDPFTMPIGGKDYYGNTNDQVFADGVTSLDVAVLFNDKGEVQFAVLNSCGNPEKVTPVTPQYSCDMLNATPVDGKQNTFSFTTSATAARNATIDHVVYDFGDGNTQQEASPTTAVEHTYTGTGPFTAKVTVFVNLPGNQQVQATSATCEKVINVTPPPPKPAFECVQLTGAILDKDKMSFTFTVTTKASGGDAFTSADFDFGDGNVQTGVKPSGDGITATTTHTYGSANTFTAKVTVHSTNSPQGVTSAACMTTVSPTAPPPPPECKPPTPECTPPPAPKPTPPSLPNTGAGNVVGMASVAIAGGFAARQLMLRRHKRTAVSTASDAPDEQQPGVAVSEQSDLWGAERRLL